MVFHPYKFTSKPEKGKGPQASHLLTHDQLCIEKAASRSAAYAQVRKREPPTGPAAPPLRNGLLGPREKEIFSLLEKKKNIILLFRQRQIKRNT